MDFMRRIISDPKIILGKPIIKGTRITVEHILKKLSEGLSADDIIENHSHLTKKDIMACLSYTAEVISYEEIIAS